MGKLTNRSLDLNDDIAAGSDCLISGRKDDHSILGQSETSKGSEGGDEMHDNDSMQAVKMIPREKIEDGNEDLCDVDYE